MKKITVIISVIGMSLASYAAPYNHDVFDSAEYRAENDLYAPLRIVDLLDENESGASVFFGLGKSRPYGETELKNEDKVFSSSLLEGVSERGLFFYIKKSF